jgi:nucleotide-binding universal stress UspA family protein
MSDAARHLNIGGRVLAALDMSAYTGSVVRYAAWAASRLDAPLELVHAIAPAPAAAVVPDLSGSIAFDAQARLLETLVQADEARGKAAQEAGRVLLQQAKAMAHESGMPEVATRLRHGTLADTLTELEADVRLFVIGKRGEHADYDRGHLGSQLERVARAVHRPLLVASREYREPRRIMVAFDGSPTTRKGIEMVAASPLFRGLDVQVLMVGEPGGRPSQDMDWAVGQLRQHGHTVDALLQPGPVNEAIGHAIEAGAIDLLVMGAYGHSRIRSMIVGSTTTHVLRTSHVPVLLLR